MAPAKRKNRGAPSNQAAACLDILERSEPRKRLRRSYWQVEELEGEELELLLRDRVAGNADVEYTIGHEDAIRMEERPPLRERPRLMAVCVRLGDDDEDPYHWVLYCAFPDGSVAYGDPLHLCTRRSVGLRLDPSSEIARRLAGLRTAPEIELVGRKVLPEQRDSTTCGYRLVDLGAALVEAWAEIRASSPSTPPVPAPVPVPDHEPVPVPEPEPDATGPSPPPILGPGGSIEAALQAIVPHVAAFVREAASRGASDGALETIVRALLGVGCVAGRVAS